MRYLPHIWGLIYIKALIALNKHFKSMICWGQFAKVNDIWGVNLKMEIENEEKIEKLANIIKPIVPDLRYWDCISIATKLIELDLIKGLENDIK